jgi:hypothetical protein
MQNSPRFRLLSHHFLLELHMEILLYDGCVSAPRWRCTVDVERALRSSAKNMGELRQAVALRDAKHNAEFAEEMKLDPVKGFTNEALRRFSEWKKTDGRSLDEARYDALADSAFHDFVTHCEEIGELKAQGFDADFNIVPYQTDNEAINGIARRIQLPDAPPEAPAGKRGRQKKAVDLLSFLKGLK